jgi:epoxyqueuosine reductase QueG
MFNIGAVLTNLDLVSDAPAENICIKECRIGIDNDNCPVNAIYEYGVNQKLCKNT